MKASVFCQKNKEWVGADPGRQEHPFSANLVLCFGGKQVLQQAGIYDLIKSLFPSAIIAMCSTAGEICQEEVLDDTLVAAALQFGHTRFEAAAVNVKDFAGSYDAGAALAGKFSQKDLVYLLLLSDGSLVNGSELIKGVARHTKKTVLITGGLAGDGPHFQSTLVSLNEQPAEGNIAAIGFYGQQLRVTHGSQGGWDVFGLEKTVTKSAANKLYEIDGQSALDLYKAYLGQEAENLPGSALLYPLEVTMPGATQPVVRTILAIDHDRMEMTFAGDIPVGSTVRFMKANFGKLNLAAIEAAKQTVRAGNHTPVFSLLVSCVGRRLILGAKTAEEVKAVRSTLHPGTAMAGFYSYGEISPFNEGGTCQLHNQTMTITSFFETENLI